MSLGVSQLTGAIIEYFSFHDSNFISGDSPVVHDIYSGLNRRTGNNGFIVNDGPGALDFEISYDGSTWGDKVRLLSSDNPFRLSDFKIHSIRVTHVADTAYRIFVQ